MQIRLRAKSSHNGHSGMRPQYLLESQEIRAIQRTPKRLLDHRKRITKIPIDHPGLIGSETCFIIDLKTRQTLNEMVVPKTASVVTSALRVLFVSLVEPCRYKTKPALDSSGRVSPHCRFRRRQKHRTIDSLKPHLFLHPNRLSKKRTKSYKNSPWPRPTNDD